MMNSPDADGVGCQQLLHTLFRCNDGFHSRSDKRFTGPHDDRLRQVRLTAVAHGFRCQEAKPLAGLWIDFEDGDMPPDFYAFEMKSGNDPIISEAEGEVRVLMNGDH
jgi:hypothetical protein